MQWLRLRAFSVPPLLFDAALACLLGVVGAIQLASRRNLFDNFADRRQPIFDFNPNPIFVQRFPFPGGPDLPTYTLLSLSAASLLLRSKFPVLCLALVTIFSALYLRRAQPEFAVQLILLVAVYSAVADSGLSRSAGVLVSLAAGAALGIAIHISDIPRTDAQWAMDVAWLLAAILLGDSVRSRRETALESERSREEAALRHASEERLRIARELHDVVGHNISLINVQANAGAHVLYQDNDKARETFDNIREASHETLQELRSLVGILRDPHAGSRHAPTVGLGALGSLIKSCAEAGQNIQLDVTGKQRDLSGVVDLSAYRILQEALTNVVRHAPNSNVAVKVHFGDDEVSLEVTNDRGAEASSPEHSGGGHGLQGMRERVLAIGGRLDVGPDRLGGFHVRAVLPLGSAT
jgi:signal transduction histidine kinase